MNCKSITIGENIPSTVPLEALSIICSNSYTYKYLCKSFSLLEDLHKKMFEKCW